MTIEKVDQIEKLTTQPLGSAINDEISDLMDQIIDLKVKFHKEPFAHSTKSLELRIKIARLNGTVTGLTIADKLIRSANVLETLTVLA